MNLANVSFTSCVGSLSSGSFISPSIMSLSAFIYCSNHFFLPILENLPMLSVPVKAWKIGKAFALSLPMAFQIGSISTSPGVIATLVLLHSLS